MKSIALPGEDPPSKRLRVDPSGLGKSPTLDKLLELVGCGDTHVNTIAERGIKAESQSPFDAGLEKLASCGNSGKNASNTEGDFQRLVKGAFGFELRPYIIHVVREVS